MKKVIYFFALFAYVIGAIGGFGYSVYLKQYVIAACIIVLAIMAFPKAKEFLNKLLNE